LLHGANNTTVEHFFQNAVKQRFSPNAYYWATKYVQEGKYFHCPIKTSLYGANLGIFQEYEENHPEEKKSNQDKKATGTKRDPSPQPSETELPPFHQPNPAPNTPPAVDEGSGEASENPAAPSTTGRPPAHRPRQHSRESPAPSGNGNNRARPHNRTEQLHARLNRRDNVGTARTRASRRPTADDLDDPFVDSSPHPGPAVASGEYSTPAAYRNHGQYPGGGYPSGDASATHDHGYPPLTGTGYDYTMPSHNAQGDQHSRAPPAEMFNPYAATGPSYSDFEFSSPNGQPHPDSGGSNSSIPSFTSQFGGSDPRHSFSSGHNSRANNTWDQQEYAGGYTSRANNTWGQQGSSDGYSLNNMNHNTSGQQGTAAGRNDNTSRHPALPTAYHAAGHHTGYHDAQPRYGLPPIRTSSQEEPQQPAKTDPVPGRKSGVTRRDQDVSNDPNYVLASYGEDDGEDIDADGDEDDSVHQETPATTLRSNF